MTKLEIAAPAMIALLPAFVLLACESEQVQWPDFTATTATAAEHSQLANMPAILLGVVVGAAIIGALWFAMSKRKGESKNG